jgi:hypothetical protein
MGLRSWFVLTIATACVSCGSGGAQREAACPAPVRTAATRLDVEALLARVTSAQICGLLADRFVGIANGDPPAGAGGGLFPSTGRWWIHSCNAALIGDYLVALTLSGPGWVWVEQEENGFRVQQFVHFNATGTFGGTIDLLAYNSRLENAAVVFHPQATPLVSSENTGELEAHAQSFFAGFAEGITLGLVGTYADSRAREEAEGLLREAFTKRLTTDLTATINVRTGQLDFLPQPMVDGAAPQRPNVDPLFEREHFFANEEQELHPGAPQIIGPLDPAAGALVDFVVDGPSVRYRAECGSTVLATLFGAQAGQAVTLLPPSPPNSGAVMGRTTRSIFLPCRWYLVTESDAPTHVKVRVHGVTWLGAPTP